MKSLNLLFSLQWRCIKFINPHICTCIHTVLMYCYCILYPLWSIHMLLNQTSQTILSVDLYIVHRVSQDWWDTYSGIQCRFSQVNTKLNTGMQKWEKRRKIIDERRIQIILVISRHFGHCKTVTCVWNLYCSFLKIFIFSLVGPEF